jgi:hypothetical protein
MLHPNTTLQYVDDRVGYGIFATTCISKGTITWAQDSLDQVFGSYAFGRLDAKCSALVTEYGWINGDGNHVMCWDFARFMNHSCQGSTFSPGLDFEIAIRDIEAGEQITTDYGSLNIEIPLSCSCESSCCRGVIHPQDFEAFADEWDALLRDAFPKIRKVEQPLWSWVNQKAAIEAGLRDTTAIPSIRVHRYRASAEPAYSERPPASVTSALVD